MTDLPAGWEWATLGEIGETALGKMLDRGKRVATNPVPYLRNVNVQWGSIDTSDVKTMHIPPDECEHYRLEPGDLLVCEGGEVGRCAIWPGSKHYMAFQKALHRIRPRGAIAPEYLRYLFEHLSMTGTLASHSTGSTIKHLPQEQVRLLQVPVPPLAEQRRIVAALEDHLARLDIGMSTLASLDRRLDRLWQSILNVVALGYPNSNEDFSFRAVGELAEVQGGIQKQQKRQPRDNTFPFLRVANVPRGRLDLREVHNIELFEGELERFRLAPGDLLVVEGNGSPDQIGRAAMWSGEIDDCVHQNHLIRVRPKPNLDPNFLALAWNSDFVSQQLRQVASSTSGLHTLSTAKVRSVVIPNPPLAIQQARASDAEAVRLFIDSSRTSIELARRHAQSLRRSLLTEAFAGRLVPQDPGDEPAAELLGRIRAERAKAGPARRARTARPVQKETLL